MSTRQQEVEDKVIRDTFRCLAEVASGTTSGDRFFPELAKKLGSVLNVRAVLIAECTGHDAPSIRILGLWPDGVSLPAVDDPLHNTACGDIYREGIKSVPFHARKTYPEDPCLALFRAEAFHGEVLRDSSRKVVGLICVIDDRRMQHIEQLRASTGIFAARAASEIERRGAVEQLRATTSRLTSLINNIQTALLMEDRDCRIILANPKFCEVFARGGSPKDLVGADGSTFVRFMKSAVDAPDPFVARVDEILREGAPVVGEQLNFADGRVFERDFIPIHMDGACLGHVWQFRDVTQRAQSERELARARDVAIEASHAKSSFLATMSHEIRTPMHGVIGMARLLLNSPLTGEQREYVETIRKCGDDLLALIDDILDISKIESDNLTLESAPFDVRDCVESALDLLAARAAENSVELLCDIAPGTPTTVIGDPTRVRQILFNLLTNAVKFTQRGQVVVRLAAREGQPGAQVMAEGAPVEFHFQVQDTGIGIPADKLDRLFKPFSQVDSSTTREYGGTGLGLAICRRLCRLMKGDVWVESEPGHGSNFQFTIRLPFTATVPPGEPEPSPELLSGAPLLIVEANDAGRQILEHQCLVWGMVPESFPDCRSALARIAAGGQFDAGIVDAADAPGQAFELAAAIGRLPTAQHPRLILLHPIGEVTIAENAYQAGFAATLAKPARASNLRRTLLFALGAGAAPVDSAPKQRRNQSKALIDPTLAEQRPLRILLAEDNRVNQKVALLTLKKMGYAADVAEDGQGVLRALERQTYDLILMDVQMPQMDGIEATRRIIESLPKNRRPRIVAMTANATAEDRARCLACGMDDYLTKPLRLEHLCDVLRAQVPAG